MAIAPTERSTESSLESARTALMDCAHAVSLEHHALSRTEALHLVVDVEQVSRIVDHLQVLAARIAEEHHLAADERPDTALVPDPAPRAPTLGALGRAPVRADSAGDGFRDCAEFLRATLGIGRAEARRRLTLAEVVLPGLSPTGATVPARLETLGEAVGSCVISGRAATVIAQALRRAHPFATPDQRTSMEQHLTRQATESDEDVLRVLARRWESVLDQDGQEPTDKILRARQGVFLKGRRSGLHLLEIAATDEQFEHLATVMNSTTNPRGTTQRPDVATGSTGSTGGTDDTAGPAGGPAGGPGIDDAERLASRTAADAGGPARAAMRADGPTRAQNLLEGLVAACRIALSGNGLPATGGHRPQVLVTIDHKDLTGATDQAGSAVFAEQVSARTIRRVACDADLIPVVLGGSGQVLDVGRAQRLFPPHLRRALVARDKGCAFPDCSIPASWCEAHHLTPWSRGGSTSIDNGVLLCSHHHHTIHQGSWTVHSQAGIPWFTPPTHRRRFSGPRRNLFWQAGPAVDAELGHRWVVSGRPDPG
ncbi:HNH endonuclease signature motif containing protein [Arthrobacter sp. B0490]|uniref:HNH endonuclease signature motif containing protein n=1 Tax=Arthrobacter sp. B0490 TaxID=2058891 RepID=UPI0021581246|nr:HNH endonuclease signature motif containing protein [Arthrobacter sp. B0490]